MLLHAPLVNPYYDLHRALTGENNLTRETVLEIRKKLIWAYSWAVPSQEAIRLIAKHSPIVEWGAGTGYWSWLIAQTGARIKSFDRDPNQRPYWFSIQQGEPDQLKAFRDHALLLCWPPFESEMADAAITSFEGDILIYIGEWRGRTAHSEFHDRLENGWRCIEQIDLPVWPGFSDRLYILNRQ